MYSGKTSQNQVAEISKRIAEPNVPLTFTYMKTKCTQQKCRSSDWLEDPVYISISKGMEK
jgi:hypothetical protein